MERVIPHEKSIRVEESNRRMEVVQRIVVVKMKTNTSSNSVEARCRTILQMTTRSMEGINPHEKSIRILHLVVDKMRTNTSSNGVECRCRLLLHEIWTKEITRPEEMAILLRLVPVKMRKKPSPHPSSNTVNSLHG